jgi:hypothetical protein
MSVDSVLLSRVWALREALLPVAFFARAKVESKPLPGVRQVGKVGKSQAGNAVLEMLE